MGTSTWERAKIPGSRARGRRRDCGPVGTWGPPLGIWVVRVRDTRQVVRSPKSGPEGSTAKKAGVGGRSSGRHARCSTAPSGGGGRVGPGADPGLPASTGRRPSCREWTAAEEMRVARVSHDQDQRRMSPSQLRSGPSWKSSLPPRDKKRKRGGGKPASSTEAPPSCRPRNG